MICVENYGRLHPDFSPEAKAESAKRQAAEEAARKAARETQTAQEAALRKIAEEKFRQARQIQAEQEPQEPTRLQKHEAVVTAGSDREKLHEMCSGGPLMKLLEPRQHCLERLDRLCTDDNHCQYFIPCWVSYTYTDEKFWSCGGDDSTWPGVGFHYTGFRRAAP
jgi:hypothetical protein